jgi:hypothetical protein
MHACLPVQEMGAAKARAEAEVAARAAAEAAALAPARRVAAALSLKGYRLSAPEVQLGVRKPALDAADGSLHWPVLLMYPETGQQDVVEDWHEDDAVCDHLDAVSRASARGALITAVLCAQSNSMGASLLPAASFMLPCLLFCRCLGQTHRRCRGTRRASTAGSASCSTTSATRASSCSRCARAVARRGVARFARGLSPSPCPSSC